jgi:predicted MFS family arabinose efflux permease
MFSRRIRNPRELVTGILFALIGVAAAMQARTYTIGSATDMGPGFFPETLALLLMALGMGIVLRSIMKNGTEKPTEPRSLIPILLIICGVAGFALTIESLGLAPAIVVLLGFACFQSTLSRPREVLLAVCVLEALSIGLFIYAFKMPLNIF